MLGDRFVKGEFQNKHEDIFSKNNWQLDF